MNSASPGRRTPHARITRACVQVEDVERLLARTNNAQWEQAEAVGEGEEYRADFADDHASVLIFQHTVVHESVMLGV